MSKITKIRLLESYRLVSFYQSWR